MAYDDIGSFEAYLYSKAHAEDGQHDLYARLASVFRASCPEGLLSGGIPRGEMGCKRMKEGSCDDRIRHLDICSMVIIACIDVFLGQTTDGWPSIGGLVPVECVDAEYILAR